MSSFFKYLSLVSHMVAIAENHVSIENHCNGDLVYETCLLIIASTTKAKILLGFNENLWLLCCKWETQVFLSFFLSFFFSFFLMEAIACDHLSAVYVSEFSCDVIKKSALLTDRPTEDCSPDKWHFYTHIHTLFSSFFSGVGASTSFLIKKTRNNVILRVITMLNSQNIVITFI